jgi:hypothetical protein
MLAWTKPRIRPSQCCENSTPFGKVSSTLRDAG